MSFRVLRAGMLSTLQDLGRYGYQKFGINVAGAMDQVSLRLANILVGNREGDGALEITLTGPTLEFNADALIALTGADLSPVIDGVKVKMNCPVAVKAGAVLKFGTCRKGCRCYLATAGGYEVPYVMQSKSTYLRGGFGGVQGRALKKGDLIDSGEPSAFGQQMLKMLLQKGAKSFRAAGWFIVPPHMSPRSLTQSIRITPGLQGDAFTDESMRDLVSKPFKITTSADRLGYRLEGPKITLKEPLEMISEIATCGTVQVPPDGNPIILMADHQSVAGYPKVAQVVAADISRIAQYRPGLQIRFEFVTIEEAEKFYFEQERFIENIRIAVKSKL
ncbi:MAG: biotin-dependent carboxyltransferase family protein [Phascolarctobacterium sp.]|nr:biotin-dependent carboxyltransferase family protein [Phascolarctobacterium sp.]